MKTKIVAVGLMMLALGACSAPQLSGVSSPSTQSMTSSGRFTLASSHWSDVAKLRAESHRLGLEVRAGRLTKVQAAQHLNRFRINLVGRNSVDDSVYEVYQQAAVDSQRGAIDATQSKAYVENALRGWQQRWPNMTNKPNNPAFTNSLMEFMGMQPLQ
ncbi:hypothetical protein QG070_04980 [Kingella kingae]|uniref:hypothetical protein n=1 Tax=Kingella kingae TaxID=504 RepID=UPI00036A1122|nr:hypothetical protein [Kingella kingae]MDK4528925.1 hypothetical protein [Kingella kingae]MDK4543465.1 hypothetical protein [Kingella kingae]MDK4555062.1 hypothetical protein [Kingella kingae]MDK4563034.1 hypothetical protein [Kingella kingae]MDK4574658.1 hypothetical protein [Kingella kingae]